MVNVGILRGVLAFAVSVIVSTSAWGDPAATRGRQSAQTKPATVMTARIESLIKKLGSEDYHISERADAAIRKIGLTAIPILRKHLGSSNNDAAEWIARTLKYMERLTRVSLRASKAVYKLGEPISLTATFKNEGVAEAVISLTGLRELNGLTVITPDGNHVKRGRHYVSPGKLGNLKLAPGQECSVSMVAINRIQSIRHPRTKRRVLLRAMILRLNRPDTYYLRLHRDYQVSNEVAIRILGPGEKSSPPAARAVIQSVKLSSAQTAKLESLIKDIGSENFQTRERAAAALRKLASGGTVSALRKHLDSSDAEVADRAARIVADIEWLTRISLRASKVIYKLGEPINLTVTFKNEGIVGDVVSLTRLSELSGLIVIDQDGNHVKRDRGIVIPAPLADIKLAPGRERSVSIIALNKLLHPKTKRHLRRERLNLDRPGTYYLRLYRGSQVSNEVVVTIQGAN